MVVCLHCHQIGKMKIEKAQNQKIREVKRWNDGGGSALSSNQSCHHWPCPPPIHPIHPIPQYGFPQVWTNLMLQGRRTDNTMHNVQFVKYDVTVSFMAQVLDTVTYLVPQVLDTA